MPYNLAMPSVNDIMSVAEALEKSPVLVKRDNCVAVRNRNATCRRCVNACTADAIDVCGNDITLDASRCNACGACTVVCPTEALVPLAPTNAQMRESAANAMKAAGNRAVFACARIAAKRLADPANYVQVPCLSRLSEATLLSVAVWGAREIMLVDGGCDTCKYRACSVQANVTVAYANVLLAAQGSPLVVHRRTGFPNDMLVESPEGLHGTTRRSFFSEAVGAAKETAMAAAKVKVAQELGMGATDPGIGERLRVTESGTLPLVQVPRHEGLMNALDALGEPQVEVLDSRVFGSVSINAGKCNSCNMCAVFCPTGALRRDPVDDMGAPLRYLEFSASDCVQCGLCADVCWKGAIELSPAVSMSQLFDFEPVTFELKHM